MYRIVLEATTLAGSSSTREDEVRAYFAYVSHLINITQITIKPDNAFRREKITIHYNPQGGTSNINLKDEIEHTVSLKGHLKIIEMTVPPSESHCNFYKP